MPQIEVDHDLVFQLAVHTPNFVAFFVKACSESFMVDGLGDRDRFLGHLGLLM
jgi:hypothetical protein